jgi:hypothetical protein
LIANLGAFLVTSLARDNVSLVLFALTGFTFIVMENGLVEAASLDDRRN